MSNCQQTTGMKFIYIVIFWILFSFKSQDGENRYYRKDIGLSFIVENRSKRQKIQYRVGWDFYFWIKDDSTAIVQDIKENVVLAPRKYRISKKIDSSFVRRALGGKAYKVEKQYYHSVYSLE